jgi:hypothetical protein
MKIKLIVASLVLAATSAVAMARPAAPGYTPPTTPGFAPEVRDHRMPAREGRWSLLATGQLVRGRDIVAVNSANKIDKLKLELVGRGSMFIDKLVLTYGNGRQQIIEVDKWLSMRDASAIIDVNGNGRARKLTSIAVHGRGNGNGFRAGASFKLLAL